METPAASALFGLQRNRCRAGPVKGGTGPGRVIPGVHSFHASALTEGPHLVGILPAPRPRNPTQIQQALVPIPTPTSRRGPATTWVGAGEGTGERGQNPSRGAEGRREKPGLRRGHCLDAAAHLSVAIWEIPVLELGSHCLVWWRGRCPEGGVPDDAAQSTPGPLGPQQFPLRTNSWFGCHSDLRYSSCPSLQVAVSPCRIGRSRRRGDSQELQCAWGLWPGWGQSGAPVSLGSPGLGRIPAPSAGACSLGQASCLWAPPGRSSSK